MWYALTQKEPQDTEWACYLGEGRARTNSRRSKKSVICKYYPLGLQDWNPKREAYAVFISYIFFLYSWSPSTMCLTLLVVNTLFIWANNHTEEQVMSKMLTITLVILELWQDICMFITKLWIVLLLKFKMNFFWYLHSWYGSLEKLFDHW